MKVVLGSQSKGRKQMLMEMGYKFEVMSAGIDEKAIRHQDPQQLTMALANAKADVLLKKIHEPCLLITSDQVVAWNGQILEKPETPEEAREFLRGYAIHPAQTVTAVVVVNTQTQQRAQAVDLATVWLKPIPDALIQQFIAEGNVFSWAGGFGIQDALKYNLVEKLEGTVDSIMGLPKELTTQLLKQVSSM
ncbi:MAG: Maf family nucleotide pyrophosphatase [Patescibacteria group bacterium]